MAHWSQRARLEMPSIDPERLGKTDVAYVYYDENERPVMFRIPIEEDSAERVREELRRKEEAIRQGGPLEVTL